MEVITLQSDACDFELGIEGLKFEKNCITSLNEAPGWFSKKISSSPGPLVSDFVTHGADFEYSTLGIHVGQDDRLTFFGPKSQMIVGEFVDCREGSRTLHKKIQAKFSASSKRRLIIPRGVAHTFDGLQGIVTRDEPVWHASDDNPHWNVNNDLVSILRSETEFPVVSVNEHRMPEELHVFLTKLSQDVLKNPKAYSTRFKLKIGGIEQYVMFQENAWNDEGRDISPILEAFKDAPIRAERSTYAITGKASWTLVPNTGSAVADVVLLEPGTDASDGNLFVHHRTKKWYTFLTGEGANVRVDMLDLRADSQTFAKHVTVQTIADPRVSLVVEPGIAYRFHSDVEHYLRSENEVFVSADEPRCDIPAIGCDLSILESSDQINGLTDLPDLRCPDDMIRKMAHFELEAS